jgi:Zn-finger protein
MKSDFYKWLHNNNINEIVLKELGHLEKEDLDMVYKLMKLSFEQENKKDKKD